MTKSKSDQVENTAKPKRGRPTKDPMALRVQTTVAMGCTFEERAQLALEAVRKNLSMSNFLREKNGLEAISRRNEP